MLEPWLLVLELVLGPLLVLEPPRPVPGPLLVPESRLRLVLESRSLLGPVLGLLRLVLALLPLVLEPLLPEQELLVLVLEPLQ